MHFRQETAREGAWDDAHELLEETLSDDALPELVTRALADAELLDPEQRRHALAEVPVVARVRDVLEWIGTGRAVTGSGALRRADIAPVAALLGISARGVAKRPASGEFRGGVLTVGGEARVQSMWELVPLAAWWEALRAAGIIEMTATRVRPGPAASGWLAGASPPLEDASAVAAIFIAHVLTEAWVVLAMSFTAQVLDEADRSTEIDDPSPFDDPGIKAELARRGIVHVPGMAAEMLRELEPLLAEEGIDLDHLDGTDLEGFNAALARATERRNLSLATPVGEHRAMALTVHRLVTEARRAASTSPVS